MGLQSACPCLPGAVLGHMQPGHQSLACRQARCGGHTLTNVLDISPRSQRVAGGGSMTDFHRRHLSALRVTFHVWPN